MPTSSGFSTTSAVPFPEFHAVHNFLSRQNVYKYCNKICMAATVQSHIW